MSIVEGSSNTERYTENVQDDNIDSWNSIDFDFQLSEGIFTLQLWV